MLIKKLVNSTVGFILKGTTSTSVTLSLTGVGIIVVPIAAGADCANGILLKICSSWLKKTQQNCIKKYACIQKTRDDFRSLHATSLKHTQINIKEYHRLVNMYESYLNNQNGITNNTATLASHKLNSLL